MKASLKTQVYFRIVGDQESLRLLGDIFAENPSVEVALDEGGSTWLAISGLDGLSEGRAFAEAKRFLEMASGGMRLFAGAYGRLSIKNILWHDLETGRQRGVAVDMFEVRPAFDPSELIAKSSSGRTAGETMLVNAQRVPEIASALTILASGGYDWWEIYILLETLRDHYGQVDGKQRGNWGVAFDRLKEVHGTSKKRLEELRRTANYYRHASEMPPARLWRQPEAAKFVQTAIRHWLVEECQIFDEEMTQELVAEPSRGDSATEKEGEQDEG